MERRAKVTTARAGEASPEETDERRNRGIASVAMKSGYEEDPMFSLTGRASSSHGAKGMRKDDDGEEYLFPPMGKASGPSGPGSAQSRDSSKINLIQKNRYSYEVHSTTAGRKALKPQSTSSRLHTREEAGQKKELEADRSRAMALSARAEKDSDSAGESKKDAPEQKSQIGISRIARFDVMAAQPADAMTRHGRDLFRSDGNIGEDQSGSTKEKKQVQLHGHHGQGYLHDARAMVLAPQSQPDITIGKTVGKTVDRNAGGNKRDCIPDSMPSSPVKMSYKRRKLERDVQGSSEKDTKPGSSSLAPRLEAIPVPSVPEIAKTREHQFHRQAREQAKAGIRIQPGRTGKRKIIYEE